MSTAPVGLTVNSVATPSSNNNTKAHSPYASPFHNPADCSPENRKFFANNSQRNSPDHASENSTGEEMAISLPPSMEPDSPFSSFQPFRRSPPPYTSALVTVPVRQPSYLRESAAVNSSHFSSPSNSEPTTPSRRPIGSNRLSYYTPVSAPEGCFHTCLTGQCEFVQPPHMTPVDHPTPQFPCFRLFLGQIRFESSAAEVRWIIRHLTGITAVKVEARGVGCFLAYFRTAEEANSVKLIHKRVLFDRTGIWFARTPAQTEMMQHYIDNSLHTIPRSVRLPKDAMVVEEEKLAPSSHHHHSQHVAAHNGHHYSNHQQQHQQQHGAQPPSFHYHNPTHMMQHQSTPYHQLSTFPPSYQAIYLLQEQEQPQQPQAVDDENSGCF
jgi:hypothetical protein